MQDLDLIQFFSDWLTYVVDYAKALVPQHLWKMLAFYVITRQERIQEGSLGQLAPQTAVAPLW